MDSTSGSGSRDEAISVDMNVDLATTESANGGGEVDAGKVASIIRQLESRLAVGQVVADIDEAYSLYRTYALAKGFSVRKSKNRYFEKTQEVRLKMFLCNKEGEKISKPKKASRAKSETKTGCKAKLEISRERNSVWKVRQFHTEHNHALELPDEAQLLKSAREMTVGVVGVLEKMFSFGKSSSDGLDDIAQDCGGKDNKALNFKDANTLISVIKSSKIDSVDCRELFQHFQHRVSLNDGFFWDAEFNELGLMKNIFWRDNRCGIDYDYFGDVVSLDTNYRIEKYDLICLPFVGINHHGHNVMFGCAFLSDETLGTFEWLFRTFLRAMGNKHPQTIFMNPCEAMVNAIENVFPNTCSRFCQWHIMKDAPLHLGSLYGNAEFRGLFEKCMDGCDSEADFEGTWNQMISNHDCRDNKWLSDMYELRHKWSTAFYGNEFNAGLRSTCRSENGNHVLEEISDEVASLNNFVIAFEDLVVRWRTKEKIEDFNCKQGRRGLKHSPLLNHAGNVYTNAVYQKFELELMSGTMANSRVSKGSYGGTSWMYEVITHDVEHVRTLVFDTATLDIKCSCKKFESTGILCSHALLVLTSENVHKIPERYIVNRWTTNVKNKIERCEPMNGSDLEMIDSNQFLRFTHDLIMRSKSHMETREILIRCLEDAASKIDNYFLRLSSETKSSKRAGITNSASIMEVMGVNSETAGFDAPMESTRVSNAVLSLCEISNKRKPQLAAESSRKAKKNITDKFQALPQQMSLMSRACEQAAFPSETAQLLFHPIHSEINPAASQMFYALPTGNNGMHAQGSSRDP